MKNVVVIFQATLQETESLALAFGLGAVQAGADIRLRRLDPSPVAKLAHADAEHCARKIFVGRKASPLSRSLLIRRGGRSKVCIRRHRRRS